MKNRANRSRDCLVSEILWELPMDTVYEITNSFGKRLRGNAGPKQRGRFYAWCSW